MSVSSKQRKIKEEIEKKIAEIAAVANDLPSVIIVHDLSSGSVAYMSERGLKVLNTTLESLKAMGPTYFEKYFNPKDAENYSPKFLDMLAQNDQDKVFSYFQQVRGSENEEWSWYLSSSKVLMCDDGGKPCYAITAAHPVEELQSVTYKIERLLEENQMMRKNNSKFLELTKREKEVIQHWVNGLSSAAIAEKLFVSFSTIEQHRKNIKRKLGIKSLPELVKFAQTFNMV